MSALTIACAIVVALILVYAWGYRSGVAYCVRALKPIEDAAREMREMMRK
jgi:hypothetical protein